MTIEDKQALESMDDMFAHGNEAPVLPPADNLPDQTGTEAAPNADRARDEQGRFASQEAPKPEPVPQPAASAVATPDADEGKQPLTKAEFKGMLEEREKRQKAEARASAAEARAQQLESQRQPTQLPSDPVEIQQVIESARTGAVFDFSEKVARKEFGDETVQAAMDWGLQRAQQNPAFQAEYLRQPHPIDWAVKQFKRDKILNELGDDPDAFIEQRVAARLAALNQPAAPPQTEAPLAAASPQLAPQPTPQAPVPTRSIANATSAGGLQVVPPQGEFAALDLVHKH